MHRAQNARAWARRVTSVCRSSRSACTGVPGQRVVLAEQPVEGLLVGEAAVLEHGQQPGQVLEDRRRPGRRRRGSCRCRCPGRPSACGRAAAGGPGWATYPRSWATSAGVNVSIGCEPMAPPTHPPTARCPGQRRPRALGEETPEDPAGEPPVPRPRRAGGAGPRAAAGRRLRLLRRRRRRPRRRCAEAPGSWRSWRLRPRVLARRHRRRRWTPSCSAATVRYPDRRRALGLPGHGAPRRRAGHRPRRAAAGVADDRLDQRHARAGGGGGRARRRPDVVPALPAALRPRTPTTSPAAPAPPATARSCSPSTSRCSAAGCATCAHDFALPAGPAAWPTTRPTATGPRCRTWRPRPGPSTTSPASASSPACRSW